MACQRRRVAKQCHGLDILINNDDRDVRDIAEKYTALGAQANKPDMNSTNEKLDVCRYFQTLYAVRLTKEILALPADHALSIYLDKSIAEMKEILKSNKVNDTDKGWICYDMGVYDTLKITKHAIISSICKKSESFESEECDDIYLFDSNESLFGDKFDKSHDEILVKQFLTTPSCVISRYMSRIERLMNEYKEYSSFIKATYNFETDEINMKFNESFDETLSFPEKDQHGIFVSVIKEDSVYDFD